jgi:hypothetical protein
MTLTEIIDFLSAEQRKFRAEKMSVREISGKYRVVFYIPEHHLTKEVSIQQISENMSEIFPLIYPDLQDVLHSVVVTESVFEFESLVASESGEAVEG